MQRTLLLSIEHYFKRIRNTKKPAKPGIPTAVAYTTGIKCLPADLEAMIEAHGALTIHQAIDAIVKLRNQLPERCYDTL